MTLLRSLALTCMWQRQPKIWSLQLSVVGTRSKNPRRGTICSIRYFDEENQKLPQTCLWWQFRQWFFTACNTGFRTIEHTVLNQLSSEHGRNSTCADYKPSWNLQFHVQRGKRTDGSRLITQMKLDRFKNWNSWSSGVWQNPRNTRPKEVRMVPYTMRYTCNVAHMQAPKICSKSFVLLVPCVVCQCWARIFEFPDVLICSVTTPRSTYENICFVITYCMCMQIIFWLLLISRKHVFMLVSLMLSDVFCQELPFLKFQNLLTLWHGDLQFPSWNPAHPSHGQISSMRSVRSYCVTQLVTT